MQRVLTSNQFERPT